MCGLRAVRTMFSERHRRPIQCVPYSIQSYGPEKAVVAVSFSAVSEAVGRVH